MYVITNREGKNANVSNGHRFVEVAHMNMSPQIKSFKPNSVIKAAVVSLIAYSWNIDWSALALMNRLSRRNLASISSN